jgi:hypothetical protein
LAAITPWAAAQRIASAAPAHAIAPHSQIPRFNLRTGNFAFARGAYALRFRRSFPNASLPFPFFADSFNPDDIYSTGYPVASQPPVILLQAARAMASGNHREPSSSQPLVIELQNGRYVRVHSTPANGEALPNSFTTQPPAIAAVSPVQDLPPALLVFRDGHTEEVRDYTIADGTLYARGDYYTDGYWNKKIELSTLNLTQTQEANTIRKIKFVLPNSPNEVITRP